MDLFKKYPFDVQQEMLFRLIKTAENTEWGKKYDFKSIKTIEDFQNRVPINSYEDLKTDIERLMRGEKNILWPGMIKWFAKSSGTTSEKSKFIPVSKESLEENHFRSGRDIFAIYMQNHPDSGIFMGKGLTLGGSHQINQFNNKALYGDLSAILIENVPFWTHFIKTPSQKIALLDEWEKKLDEITKSTIKENVTNLMGVPSWNLVLIKHILQHTKADNLLDIWPNLELFIHGGVNFTPYIKQFKQLIPSEDMHYMETYNASEGFFAIQDDLEKDEMLLILDTGIFYEFIPMDGKEKDAVSIKDVKKGINYAMIISTNSGLWRYKIGDTIVFTSTFPHKIKISGRTKHYINTFGEEVIIDNAEKAINIACKKTDAIICEYTAGPIYMDKEKKGAHQWLIEFEKPPKDLEYFSIILDNALKSINSDYEAKRYKNITLDRPTVTMLNNGTFYHWLEEKGKLGGQNKVPRLSNTRKYIDDLLRINNSIN